MSSNGSGSLNYTIYTVVVAHDKCTTRKVPNTRPFKKCNFQQSWSSPQRTGPWTCMRNQYANEVNLRWMKWSWCTHHLSSLIIERINSFYQVQTTHTQLEVFSSRVCLLLCWCNLHYFQNANIFSFCFFTKKFPAWWISWWNCGKIASFWYFFLKMS